MISYCRQHEEPSKTKISLKFKAYKEKLSSILRRMPQLYNGRASGRTHPTSPHFPSTLYGRTENSTHRLNIPNDFKIAWGLLLGMLVTNAPQFGRSDAPKNHRKMINFNQKHGVQNVSKSLNTDEIPSNTRNVNTCCLPFQVYLLPGTIYYWQHA